MEYFMNNRQQPTAFKSALLATSLLAVVTLYGNQATAASLNNQLKNDSSATDFFRVTCSKNDNGETSRLKVAVLDKSPDNNAMVSIQAIKGILGKNITDTNRKDTKPSPNIFLTGGNGVYEVRVNKTGAGIKKYNLDYRCLTSNGKWAGTAISTVQNH